MKRAGLGGHDMDDDRGHGGHGGGRGGHGGKGGKGGGRGGKGGKGGKGGGKFSESESGSEEDESEEESGSDESQSEEQPQVMELPKQQYYFIYHMHFIALNATKAAVT